MVLVTSEGDRINIGENGCYASKIDDMNFQIFNASGQDLGLVWEVTGSPGQFRCVPTSNIGRPIPGGTHTTLREAAEHCIQSAVL
jgi:hypothetical protein